MPSFNSIVKLGKSIGSGDIKNIPNLINSAGSILTKFQNPTGSAFVSDNASYNGILGSGGGHGIGYYIKRFPLTLGSSDYPSWIELSIWKRQTITMEKSFAQAEKMADTAINSVAKGGGDVMETLGGLAGIGGDENETSAAGELGKLGVTVFTEAKESLQKYNYMTMVPGHVMSINLPLMANMGADAIAVNTSDEELGSKGKRLVSGGQALTGTQGGGAGDIAKELGKGLMVKALNMGEGVGTALSIATGHVENPFSFTVFKDVSHRTFTFTWNLVPKSHEESNALYDIIDILKENMLPENKKTLLGVPNEFKIQYWHMIPESVSSFTGKVEYGQQENPYYPESSYCYLTSLTHTPNEQGDTLHPDGAPASHQLMLTFNELRPLDREAYRDKLNLDKKNLRDGTPPEGTSIAQQNLSRVGDAAKDFL